jgi:hypothetical protein
MLRTVDGRFTFGALVRDHWAGNVWSGTDQAGQRVLGTVVNGDAPDDRRLRTALAMARVPSGLGERSIASTVAVSKLEDGRVVMVTEFVEGLSLRELTRSSSISLARVLHILARTCKMLSRAHDIGCLHGAVSPDAILIQHLEDEDDRVVVTDFGLRSLFGDRGPDRAALLDGAPISPECGLAMPPSPSEDVYLVGALGHRLIAGRPPFETGDLDSLRRCHAIEDAPPLGSRVGAGALHPSVPYIVDRCLAKEPDHRFKDASTLLDHVTNALAEIGAPPPDTSAMHAKPLEPRVPLRSPASAAAKARAKTRVGLFIGLGGVAVLAIAVTIWIAQQREPAESDEDAPTEPALVAKTIEVPVAIVQTREIAVPMPVATEPAPVEVEIEEPEIEEAGAGTKKDPSLAPGMAQKGKSALARGNGGAAEQWFKSALFHDPRNLTALRGLGDLYFNRASYSSSARYLKRATRAAPKDGSLRIMLGDAYFKMGKTSDAKAQYQKAKELGTAGADKRLAKIE